MAPRMLVFQTAYGMLGNRITALPYDILDHLPRQTGNGRHRNSGF